MWFWETEKKRKLMQAEMLIESMKRNEGMYHKISQYNNQLLKTLDEQRKGSDNAITLLIHKNWKLRSGLRIIAGLEQCVDNLMSNKEVALAAMAEEEALKEAVPDDKLHRWVLTIEKDR